MNARTAMVIGAALAAVTAAAVTLPRIAAAAGGHEGHDAPALAVPAGNAVVAQDPALPAGAADVVARLAASPRHGEWQVVRTGPNDSIRVWVVYPERATRAPVVLVVHEIFGVSHWIRGVADQLAAAGFIAIAPDLLTMKNIPQDETGQPVGADATREIRTLDPAVYHQQLQRIAQWGMNLPAATQRYGIVGFCWGGAASFQHAVTSPEVDAAVVYYGSSPTTGFERITAPVLGLYAGDDARVNATIPQADSAMRRLGRAYEPHLLDGAGHGFLRQQDGREGANLAATRRAWPLTVQFFRRHLESGQ